MDANNTELTPTQLVAVALAMVGVLLDATIIDGETAKLLTGISSIVIPAVWILANAIIHYAHKKAAGAVLAAQTMTSDPGSMTNLELKP